MTEPNNYPQQSSYRLDDDTSPVLDEIAFSFGPQIHVSLLVLALAALGYPIYFMISTKLELGLPARVWWLIALSASALLAELVNAFYNPVYRLTHGERLRIVLVLLGGLWGAFTAAYGMILPFTQYADIFGGGFTEWRKNPGPIFWTVLPIFGGLLLTFLSLLLTAGLERTSPTARRLLYGYNSILSALLLLFILLLLNVLPYSGVAPFKSLAQTSDWTSSGLYTLSQATRERLASIEQPVKVYVLLTGSDLLSNDVETLLQNCHEINSRISWETLSRDLNRKQFSDLVDKYQLSDPAGLVVVYGVEPNTSFEFIPRKDLAEDVMTTGDTGRYSFKGESALTNALTFLAEGKTKSVVYFTQGHGELDLADRSMEHADMGIGEAAETLGKTNYETRPLTFDATNPKVPDDADVVVVARPRTPLPAKVVDALRAFANGTSKDTKKKGKFFILLDVVPTREGKMAPTGLDSLLTEFGVQLGNDRLINVADSRDPTQIIAITNPQGSNPIARAFFHQGSFSADAFYLIDARTVTPTPPPPPPQPQQQPPPPPSRYVAEKLMLTLPPPDEFIVTEADLNVDPASVGAELRKDEDKLRDRVVRDSLSLAVTVSENKNMMPQIPGHDFGPRPTQPRAIVFGDATWVTNREIGGRNGRLNRDLFVSCINWLRERPDIGTQAVEAKTRSEFRLPEQVSMRQLVFLPIGLIFLFVISLGTGVWLVRRR